MNKLFKILLSIILVLSLTACTNKETNTNDKENNDNITDNQNTNTNINDAVGTDKKEENTDKTEETVQKTSIKEAKISSIQDQKYTGKAISPTVKVTLGDKTLKKDTDYTISYSNNVNEGTAKVTVTGTGNYEGTVTKSFKIVKEKETDNTSSQQEQTSNKNDETTTNKKISISDCNFSGVNKSYTLHADKEKAIKPVVTVTYNGKTLKEGTDYTVKYFNEDLHGMATVVVYGCGNYTGEKHISYWIEKNYNQPTLREITLNKITTYYCCKGVFTKASNWIKVDWVGLGLLAEGDTSTARGVIITECYDKETGENIYFAVVGDDWDELERITNRSWYIPHTMPVKVN